MQVSSFFRLANAGNSLISRVSSSALSANTWPRAARNTGAFRALIPDVFEGKTHFKRAHMSLHNLPDNANIKNIRARHRKITAQSMDALMKGLTVPITQTLAAYDTMFKAMHPYEVLILILKEFWHE